MADRILTWYFKGTLDEVERYYMDQDYEPVACRIVAKENIAGEVFVDIRKDGISIFGDLPSLADKQSVEEMANNALEGTILEKHTVISCDISTGAVITVQLELDSADAEDE